VPKVCEHVFLIVKTFDLILLRLLTRNLGDLQKRVGVDGPTHVGVL
jgi:hypothetical protein